MSWSNSFDELLAKPNPFMKPNPFSSYNGGGSSSTHRDKVHFLIDNKI